MILRNARRHLRGPAALLFALVASVSTAALGSGGESGKGQSGSGFSLTPFSRVAVIRPNSDPVDAYDEAKAAATAIATYVAAFDDTPDFGSNWVLGGFEGAVSDPPTEEEKARIEEAILRVPTPYLIDPYEPMSPTNRKKVNIVEMCNKTFAQKALGLLPVVEGDDTTKIIDGYIHAPALPCEVAIYADEDGSVKVDMLQPEAIFTLFFTDVLFGEQMLDPDFAAAIQELPAVVNEQIRTIIQTALDGAGFDLYAPIQAPRPDVQQPRRGGRGGRRDSLSSRPTCTSSTRSATEPTFSAEDDGSDRRRHHRYPLPGRRAPTQASTPSSTSMTGAPRVRRRYRSRATW